MERKWWTLLVVCVAVFMLLLDITIVNVALPKIASDLHASFSDIQWVIDAYALTLASLLLTAGSLADLLGRKRIFAIGLGLFSLTSLLCALSPSSLFLILARAAQGIGGAILLSTSLALVAQEFHGRERGTAFAAYGATIAASAAVGPLLGGVLTSGLGWPSIFLINVPVGIAGVGLTLTKVKESRNPAGVRLDWIGTVTFTGALFMLVFAVIRSSQEGWGSSLILALVAGSIVLLAVFIVSQFRQRNAMFDVTLFRKPTFSGVSIAVFTVSAGMFAMFLYIVLFFQTILGYSPLQAGVRFLPFTVVSFFVAAAAGRLTSHAPVRLIMSAGLALTGLGLMLMRGLTVSSGWTAMLAGFIVAGAGVGLVNPAIASTAIGVVPPQQSGMASGMNSTFRQVGVAAGIAGLGSIFQSRISTALAPALRHTPVAGHVSSVARAVAGGASKQVVAAVPAADRARATLAVHAAFVSALNDILLVGGLVAFAGAVASLLLVRGRDFAQYGTPQPAPAG